MIYDLNLISDPDDITSEDNGNFSVKKEFTAKNMNINNTIYKNTYKKTKKPNIVGIVIQYVNKTSRVVDAVGNIYNTTDEIKRLTSDVVNYSNDAYFEIFPMVKSGHFTSHSKFADEFQNNSLTQYERDINNELVPYTYDINDPLYETYKTEGEINIVGENCFIAIDNNNYNQIVNLNWNTSIDTPANGLNYLPYSVDNYNLFFSSTNSNILVHTVNVTWSFAQPKSVISSVIIPNKPYTPIAGGKHKRKRFNKSEKSKKKSKKNSKKKSKKKSKKNSKKNSKKKP